MTFFERLENWAARKQGKGWGGFTCEQEVSAIKDLLTKNNRPDPQVVIDVGANVGKWTAAAMASFPKAHFYLFEPSRQNIETLQGRLNSPQVKIQPYALSDKEGEQMLFSDQEGSGLASLQQRDLRHVQLDHHATYKVHTSTLNQFMATEQLDRIDVMKMDVEGHELTVLQGASNWVEKIGVLQFEFGGSNIDSRTYFKDFWDLLSPHFTIYRIAQGGLDEIGGYHHHHECFRTTNYIALNKRG